MPAVSKKQQKFFGIVRAIQKGEMAPTSPETAKAAETMKKGDVKDFASSKHKGLPEKKVSEQAEQEVSGKIDKKKEMMDRQRLANMKMLQMKQQQMERQALQMKKVGKLPIGNS